MTGGMSIASLVVLAVVSAVGLLLTAWGERLRPHWGAAVLAVLLAFAAALAWMAERAPAGVVEVAVIVDDLDAAAARLDAGGAPVTTTAEGHLRVDPAVRHLAAGHQRDAVERHPLDGHRGALLGRPVRLAVRALHQVLGQRLDPLGLDASGDPPPQA